MKQERRRRHAAGREHRMGKLFYIMGKSASGKDSVYNALLNDPQLGLHRIVLYTTRPIREHETDGRDYRFVSEEELSRLRDEGRVVEERAYDTVHGIWRYATADDGSIDLAVHNYLAIGTLESYRKIRDYFGAENVVPLYIEVEDGERLARALGREREQKTPKYAEMCRRFLADEADFSEENIRAAGIGKRYPNNGSMKECLADIEETIRVMV